MPWTSKYDPKFCELFVEMGKEGRGVVEFCAAVGVTKPTLTNWANEHPEFAEAREMHRIYCQAWWEERGRKGMTEANFNATIWTKNMNNRFRDEWGEKVDVGVTGGVTLTKITRRIVDGADG
jgi:hypothetical protein